MPLGLSLDYVLAWGLLLDLLVIFLLRACRLLPMIFNNLVLIFSDVHL